MSTKEVKDWITVNGQHVPIFEGESKNDAVNRAIAKINEDKKESDIKKNKEQADKLNNKQEIKDDENFDIKSLGELKDADDLHDFITENIDNPKFKQFGKDNSMEAVQQLWYENKRQQEIKDLKEVKIEDAIQTVRDNINDLLLYYSQSYTVFLFCLIAYHLLYKNKIVVFPLRYSVIHIIEFIR